jgi:hypothetical protein
MGFALPVLAASSLTRPVFSQAVDSAALAPVTWAMSIANKGISTIRTSMLDKQPPPSTCRSVIAPNASTDPHISGAFEPSLTQQRTDFRHQPLGRERMGEPPGAWSQRQRTVWHVVYDEELRRVIHRESDRGADRRRLEDAQVLAFT